LKVEGIYLLGLQLEGKAKWINCLKETRSMIELNVLRVEEYGTIRS